MGHIEDVRLDHVFRCPALAGVEIGDLVVRRAIVIFDDRVPVNSVGRLAVAVMIVILVGGVPEFEFYIPALFGPGHVGGGEVVLISHHRLMADVPGSGHVYRERGGPGPGISLPVGGIRNPERVGARRAPVLLVNVDETGAVPHRPALVMPVAGTTGDRRIDARVPVGVGKIGPGRLAETGVDSINQKYSHREQKHELLHCCLLFDKIFVTTQVIRFKVHGSRFRLACSQTSLNSLGDMNP